MRRLLVVPMCLFAVSAAGQSMTSISPNYGPGETSGSITITGTGFSTVPKATRFVDANNVDVLDGIFCASSTSCTSSFTRAGLVAPGAVETIAVFALVNGVKSASFAGFVYYGPPVITSVSPNLAPTRSGIGGISITGGPFTDSPSYPGTTSLYLQSNINDRVSGCASTSLCDGYSAPGLSVGVPEGYSPIQVITPGGAAPADFFYVTIPATPVIASVTPRTGSRDGGTSVTITGSGFSTVAGKTIFSAAPATGFGGSDLTDVVCATTSSCTATMPFGNGKSDIRVYTNPGSPGTWSKTSQNTSADDFTYHGLNIWPTQGSGLTTSEGGSTTTMTVALNTQPANNVTVALNRSGDIDEGTLSTASLLFTPSNWNVAQTVTITGVNDALADGNRGHSINPVASSVDPNYDNVFGNGVQVTNKDNESAGYFFSHPSGLTTTEAGGAATLIANLLTQPSSTVTLNLVSNDPGEGTVSPASITFTTANWATPRVVTLTGVADAIQDGTAHYSIITTASTADPTYGAIVPENILVMNVEAPPATVRGDFNGDGKPDLLWRNYSTGAVNAWFLNGTTYMGGASLFTVAGSNWRIEGTGDFNADGKTDLIWRNYTTGAVNVWFLNGTSYLGGANLFTVADLDWEIDVVGDFNGDGKDDLIWRNYATGAVNAWFMNGTTYLGGASLFTVPDANWTIEVSGDFDGDGKTDLIWRNYATGAVNVWFLNGTTYLGGTNLFTVADPNWNLEAVGDYSGDGKLDLIWRNYASGAVNVWFMNGTSYVGGASLFNVAGASWEIAGPR